MTMMRIAVTGGIAAGKSTVVNHLRSLGAFVIDYDVLARKVVEPGSVGLRKIVSIFGEDAVKNDGSLNREFIAKHVFGDSYESCENRKKLESLIHPAIYDLAKTLEVEYISEYVNKISEENRSTEENHSALGSMSSIIVHDIPLLAQVIDSIPFSFDYIITVEAPKDVRIARMISERKMSQNQAQQRINNQVEEIERKKIADFVVDSTKPMEVMLKNVDSKIKTWMSKEH
ncbi:dephospho-CoA kinase [Gardnerella vaginalis]|uniref:dephospho-CoA kinase n=1 Tax=Gardnerella vaginalis TaxID=2702 RepID=UPI000352F6A4|nr:dephospho-CoA kinase [Gardnerella vaginalis]EPI58252.1 dephospho-CoA kinase [Gardnerella vaginalis JCP8066]RDW96827.1 dephospho-CoA kinase [Gardnerella vaginalis]